MHQPPSPPPLPSENSGQLPPPLPNHNAYTPPTTPGPIAAKPPASGLAIGSLVCGILGILSGASCCFGFLAIPFGITGLILGIVAKPSSGIRTAGIICSIVALVFALGWTGLIILDAFAPSNGPYYGP